MLKKIKIMDRCGNFWPVWAWVDGNLAVHKALADIKGALWDNLWTITHVPTGLVVRSTADAMLRERVAGEWQRAKDFTWRGMRPFEELAACELIELAPTIALDVGVSPESARDWHSYAQPIASEALRCEKGGH